MAYFDERTNIAATAKWINPYTNKEEILDTYLPKSCVEKNIIPFFKNNLNIEIHDIQDFYTLLDKLDRSIADLENFDDFVQLCLLDYYKTDYYEKDVREELDDYEFKNYLGEYSEEDTSIE